MPDALEELVRTFDGAELVWSSGKGKSKVTGALRVFGLAALDRSKRHGEQGPEWPFIDSALELVVTNPLPTGAVEQRAGHGIVGMRERAALVGGTLEAQAEDGSFRVTATLPYREAS